MLFHIMKLLYFWLMGASSNLLDSCEKKHGNVKQHVFVVPFRFAYIEFADKDSVDTAMALDGSFFRGRQIKVG